VTALAREHTTEAVSKLAEWMRSDNPKASVSACLALLDRGYGKPTQTTESTVELEARVAGLAPIYGLQPTSED